MMSIRGYARCEHGSALTLIISGDFDPDSVMPIGHLTDRGSTGSAAMAAILPEGLVLWIPNWGAFHDG